MAPFQDNLGKKEKGLCFNEAKDNVQLAPER